MQHLLARAIGEPRRMKRPWILAWCVITLVALFNLFAHLGDDGIDAWDEARRGVAAAEMLVSGVNQVCSSPRYCGGSIVARPGTRPRSPTNRPRDHSCWSATPASPKHRDSSRYLQAMNGWFWLAVGLRRTGPWCLNLTPLPRKTRVFGAAIIDDPTKMSEVGGQKSV